MAQPNLESFKRRGLVLALRTAADTPAQPKAATNGILLFNGTSGTEFDKVERPVDRPFLTGQPFAVGIKRAFIEGEFELYPPATPGAAAKSDADCAPLLLPAGMTVVKNAAGKTTRYNPISTNFPISDARFWHAGTVLPVLAARHNLTGLAMTIGDRFKGNVRIQGTYEAVEKEALPNVVVPTQVPVVVRADNSTAKITVGSGAALSCWFKSLSVDMSNTLVAKEYTTKKETGISDRAPTWTARIAQTDLADFNPWAARDAAQIIQLSMRLTESSKLYSELGARGQIDTINVVDIDGDYGWELSGPCVASASGGDEFYIEFGDSTT